MSKGRLIKSVLPWIITIVALYLAFRGIDWSLILSHLGDANSKFIVVAFLLTCTSYIFRSRRWQGLFEDTHLRFQDSVRVLILGFFMNNILPARAGELVRAHLGSKVTGETRTLVLASIAIERIIDGLTISIMFVIFAFGLGDAELSRRLSYVAFAFAGITVGVIFVIAFRDKVFSFVDRVQTRFHSTATKYFTDKLQIFINGLSPMCSWDRIPALVAWSAVIWGTELLIYIFVNRAFGAGLNLAECVLFLVAVNFSSLIPAAPGGIGVIEAVSSAVLVSMGTPRELALIMVLTQHAIQYVVIGIPGAALLLTWRAKLPSVSDPENLAKA